MKKFLAFIAFTLALSACTHKTADVQVDPFVSVTDSLVIDSIPVDSVTVDTVD